MKPSPKIHPQASASFAQDREVRLEAGSYSKLETLAASLGVSVAEALRHLIDTGTTPLETPREPQLALSQRQAEVLKRLQAGLSVKEIASQLTVTEDTVRTHIHRTRTLLGCADLLRLRFNGLTSGNRGAPVACAAASLIQPPF